MKQDFYVYVYKRPNGEPFYVGKGIKRRVYSLSPSRRTKHFMNVVRKYGADNLLLEFLRCSDETEAFAWETKLIEAYKREGFSLTNLTAGGEGASGRIATDRMRENLAKWQGAYHRLNDSAKKNVLEGLARGRAKSAGWRKSEEGKRHLSKLTEIGRVMLAKTKEPRLIICGQCGDQVVKHSLQARFCSRLCEQRNRRARTKQ